MDKSLKRRISISSSWASSRIALLDTIERYEDSYAITQEFREWIISVDCKNNQKDYSLLKVPKSFEISSETNETDEVLER